MFDVGLSNTDLAEFLKTLRTTHIFACRVQILDLDHNYKSNVTNAVMDGQISVNWNGEDATRVLDLMMFDPEYDLGFDTSQFVDGVWFLDRMVQVVAEIWVPSLARTVECPLFTGPVNGFKRRNATVTLSCVGKDWFARKSWPRLVIPKGTNYATAIRMVLAELGETKFKFYATTTSVLAEAKTIDRDMELTPWGWCRSVAASHSMRLHYDGEGYAVLRNRNDVNPVYVFRDGDDGALLTEPETDGDYSRLANVARAEGAQPASGTAPFGEATVDVTSPIHPSKLTRGGKPLYLGVVVQRDSITTAGQAVSAAKDELRDRQFAAYSIDFDALPVFLLEEGDYIGVQSSGISTTNTLLTFSFGLKPDAHMPVGYSDLVSPALARIRRF